MVSSQNRKTASDNDRPAGMLERVRTSIRRLYNGDTDVDFIGLRRVWYIISMVLMTGSIGVVLVQGFNLGIEFAGGNQFEAVVNEDVELSELVDIVESHGVEVSSSQIAGTGNNARYIIRTGDLDQSDSLSVREDLAEELGSELEEVAVSEVSSSWGASVSEQAIYALIVFVFLVSLYMWWRYDLKMAGGALVALVHDLVLTAGIYALVGFEVTPGTVIGILTILGYSLYDTVVVYDKVFENLNDVTNRKKYTFAENANRAVNQTLMRSINTSIIGLLPVAGLLFVGAGLLGVGTLKDLALVLFVGMLTGTYSSLFLATPVVVDTEYALVPDVRAQDRKIKEKRAAALAKTVNQEESEEEETDTLVSSSASTSAPRPGARPASRRPKRKKR